MTKLSAVITVISIILLVFYSNSNVQASNSGNAIDINELIDHPFRSGTDQFTTFDDAVSTLTSRVIDFVHYSILSVSDPPISALNLQNCIILTLKSIIKELKSFESYNVFLDRIGTRLKDDSSIYTIFASKSIDRLIKVFRRCDNIINRLLVEDENTFNRGFEIILNSIELMVKDFSAMEPENIYEFFGDFLNNPNTSAKFEISLDLLEKMIIETTEIYSPITKLSTYQVLDKMVSSDNKRILEDGIILDDFDEKRLKIILRLTEFQIRNLLDCKINDGSAFGCRHTQPGRAELILQDNLNNFSKLPKEIETFEKLKSVFVKIFQESVDIDSREIDMISYLIQEFVDKADIAEFEDFDSSSFKALYTLIKEIGNEKFLEHLNVFLSTESIEIVKEIIKKLGTFELVDFEDLIISILIGFDENFQLYMKEFIFKEIIGINPISTKTSIFGYSGNLSIEEFGSEESEDKSVISSYSNGDFELEIDLAFLKEDPFWDKFTYSTDEDIENCNFLIGIIENDDENNLNDHDVILV